MRPVTKKGERISIELLESDRAGSDVQQVRVIKDRDGNVVMNEESALRQ